jgi:hypothetical protein
MPIAFPAGAELNSEARDRLAGALEEVKWAACRATATAASHRGSLGSTQVMLCGICVGLSGNGAGFAGVRRFPLPILFHQLLHTQHNDHHLQLDQ